MLNFVLKFASVHLTLFIVWKGTIHHIVVRLESGNIRISLHELGVCKVLTLCLFLAGILRPKAAGLWPETVGCGNSLPTGWWHGASKDARGVGRPCPCQTPRKSPLRIFLHSRGYISNMQVEIVPEQKTRARPAGRPARPTDQAQEERRRQSASSQQRSAHALQRAPARISEPPTHPTELWTVAPR